MMNDVRYAVDFLLKGETKWRRTMFHELCDLPLQEKILWENPIMVATSLVAIQPRLLTPKELSIIASPMPSRIMHVPPSCDSSV